MKNVVLVGFMGTGKTVVAKKLASDMGKKYVSTDELIEMREKRAITDIFRDEGEAFFRLIEKEVVKKVSEEKNQVIDAGGGVVLDSDNMENLKKSGIIICLWTDPQTIYQRTKKYKHRPLLNVEDPTKSITELLDYRRPFYEKASFCIDTTNLDVGSVVKEVKRIINEEEKTE